MPPPKKTPRLALAQALLDMDRRLRATSRLAARLERTCASCPHHDLETAVIGFRLKQDDANEELEQGKPRPRRGRGKEERLVKGAFSRRRS
jgi:hypothetical protein